MEVQDKGECKYWRSKWEEAQKELTVLRSLIHNQLLMLEKKLKNKSKKT